MESLLWPTIIMFVLVVGTHFTKKLGAAFGVESVGGPAVTEVFFACLALAIPLIICAAVLDNILSLFSKRPSK